MSWHFREICTPPGRGGFVICVQVIAFAVVRYDGAAQKEKKKKLLREQVNFKKKNKWKEWWMSAIWEMVGWRVQAQSD